MSKSPECIEIGLVLAGAVSAGAYTAGVLDLLVEALDAWEDAKARGDDVPNHDVRLKIIVGASAGGMNGAIAASALPYAFPPAREPEAAAANPFYVPWVKSIDIVGMLGSSDLNDDGGVPSFLDTGVIDSIAVNGLKPPGAATPKTRKWLADPFRVTMTVTNLRGVRYRVLFEGAGRDAGAPAPAHDMSLHRDFLCFAATAQAGKSAAPLPGAVHLNADRDDASWETLAQVALATGAFPLFLKSRYLERDWADYEDRVTYVDGQGNRVSVAPHGPHTGCGSYRFEAVDGGAMNNEPFDLAASVLPSPPSETEAGGVIVMIDPFVDPLPDDSGDKRTTLLGTIGRLLGAYKNQSRFVGGDWIAARDRNIFDRFLVAPSRTTSVGRKLEGDEALATGRLSGFLGFFDEEFRAHDFMLGRHNCRRFLENYFTLPADFALFASWRNDTNLTAKFGRDDAEGYRRLQIIPVVADSTVAPDWPIVKDHLRKSAAGREVRIHDRIDRLVDERMKRVSKLLLEDALRRLDVEPWLFKALVKAYAALPLAIARWTLRTRLRTAFGAALRDMEE